MEKISIEKINEVYVKVHSEKNVAYELNDYFTFRVPGFQFMPAYRNKIWDGNIRLFSITNGHIYSGLLPYIEKYAKDSDWKIEYTNFPPACLEGRTVSDIHSYVKNLNLPFEIRDYQMNAVEYGIIYQRCLIVSPTASGKSLIIYCILRFLLDFIQEKVLIIVPTTSLVEQLYSDFIDYSKQNDWNTEEYCHRIYAGHAKETDKRVIISTWQSVYRLQKKFFEPFGAVFGDEAHFFKAKSLTTLMTKLTNSAYRFGSTGTLDGTETHQLVLEGLFGAVYRATTTKELMEQEHISTLDIECIVLQYADEIKKEVIKCKYAEELDFLVSYKKRNEFITDLSLNLKGNTLILYNYVEKHGRPLNDMMKTKLENTKRKVFFVYGGTATEAREHIRFVAEKEKDAIIIASYGTFSTGINIRNLHNIIFASPFKSKIRNLQSIGRGLRLGDEKTKAKLFDISDNLSWKSKKNYTLNHFLSRVETYNNESFDYIIRNISI